MVKRVKGGIEKHYCDCCGKLLYDYIPIKTINFHGINMTTVKEKTYIKEWRILGGRQFCSIECENKSIKRRPHD